MKIRLILSVFVVIALAFLMIASPVAAQVNGSEDTVFSSPIDGTLTVSIQNGSEDAAGINPDAVIVSTTNGGEDTVNASPIVPPTITVTEVDSTPVNNSGSSSGSGSRGSSQRYLASPVKNVVSVAATDLNCPIITSELLKVGGNNDSADVSRLQAFLKNVEKLDVDVNGTFDTKTESAVKAFQIKYKDSILLPWNATKSSGVVYITTIKKINEIACGNVLTMSPKELSIIDTYNKKVSNVGTSNTTDENTVIGATTDSPVTVANASSSVNGGENTATASNAPVLRRFWDFVVGLFH